MNREIIVQNIIDDLRGTCQELNTVCEKYGTSEDDLTEEELIKIDESIFCCSYCGWWLSFDEESLEDWVCKDCYEYSIIDNEGKELEEEEESEDE